VRARKSNLVASLLAGGCLLAGALAMPVLAAAPQVPAGARFLVEIRDKLEAGKIKRGKKFEARTLDVLEATDGRIIPPDTKMRGRVSYVQGNKMVLRFERIETRWGKLPVTASVVGVFDEPGAKQHGDDESAIQAKQSRGKSPALGALAGGGNLVLEKGTRLQLRLDRPLVLVSEE
jgi:hypothetical protein